MKRTKRQDAIETIARRVGRNQEERATWDEAHARREALDHLGSSSTERWILDLADAIEAKSLRAWTLFLGDVLRESKREWSLRRMALQAERFLAERKGE